MDRTGAGAFIFAKANGILGKSFTGKRAQKLFSAKSLGELWTLLFRSQPPMVPEVLLSQQIEEKAFSDFINQFVQFISLYDKPEELLKDQLLMYEGENLKELGAALCKGETKCPSLINLKKYSMLNYAAWPDIKKITKGTAFSWYNKVPGIHEQQELDFKIDIQICRHLLLLWKLHLGDRILYIIRNLCNIRKINIDFVHYRNWSYSIHSILI